MFFANQIFKQLEHANRFAKSKLLQENRISLILLDNLVEVILRKHSETSFGFDRPSWINDFQEKYPRKARKNISSFFDELLMFACKENLIVPAEKTVLKFTHTVRNQAYHENSHDTALTTASILLLMSLLRKNLPRWKTGASFYQLSPNNKSSENLFFDNTFDVGKTYAWEKIICRQSDFLEKSRKKPSNLLKNDLLSKIREIEKRMQFLKKDLGDYNLNEINSFNHFPFNQITLPRFKKNDIRTKVPFFIQFCFYSIENKGNYRNSTDKAEVKELVNRLVSYMKEPDNRLQVDLNVAKEKINQMSSASDEAMIDSYNNFNSKIQPLHIATQEAAIALDGYIQHIIDVARGK